MSTLDPAPAVKVLQVSCSHCGHIHAFERDEQLTVAQLEVMSAIPCTKCATRGSIFEFVSYAASQRLDLERLPPSKGAAQSSSSVK